MGLRLGASQGLVQGQGLVQPRATSALGEVGGGVVLSVQYPLGGQQALHAHRSAGVDAGGRDAHLGSKPEPEAVREP